MGVQHSLKRHMSPPTNLWGAWERGTPEFHDKAATINVWGLQLFEFEMKCRGAKQ